MIEEKKKYFKKATKMLSGVTLENSQKVLNQLLGD